MQGTPSDPNQSSLPRKRAAPISNLCVPKAIHQIFFPGRLPPIIEDNVRKIKAMNPGWAHTLYDEADMADFIGDHYGPRMLGSYLRINTKYGASRADFFRYLLMYKRGGLYLDIKSSLALPLDAVIRADDSYLLSRWRNGDGEVYAGWGKHPQLKAMGGNEFQQWHIIAAPAHPFLEAVIQKVQHNVDTYNPIRHGTGRDGVLHVTGPIAYTQAIAPLLRAHPHRVVDSENDLGFNYSIFGAPGARAHKAIFKFHYTDLSEPIAELAGLRKWAWALFGPVQNRVIQPIRDLLEALSRRRPVRASRRR